MIDNLLSRIEWPPREEVRCREIIDGLEQLVGYHFEAVQPSEQTIRITADEYARIKLAQDVSPIPDWHMFVVGLRQPFTETGMMAEVTLCFRRVIQSR